MPELSSLPHAAAQAAGSGFTYIREGHSVAIRLMSMPGQIGTLLLLELDEAVYTFTPAEADRIGLDLRQNAAAASRGQPREARTEAEAVSSTDTPVTHRELVHLLRRAAPHSTPATLLAAAMTAAGWTEPEASDVQLTEFTLAAVAQLRGWRADALHAASWAIERYAAGDHAASALLRAAAARMRGHRA